MFYSIKAKRLSVNHSEIMKVSSYNFAKSKIAHKQAKIYIFNSAKKYGRYKNFDCIFGFRRPKTSCVP